VQQWFLRESGQPDFPGGHESCLPPGLVDNNQGQVFGGSIWQVVEQRLVRGDHHVSAGQR
jgi:hypothetical protein